MRGYYSSSGVCISLHSFRDVSCLTKHGFMFSQRQKKKEDGGTTAHRTNPYLASLQVLPISQHVALEYHASVANSARRYPSEIYNSCVKHFVCPVLKINKPNLFLNISLTPETSCFCGGVSVCECMHVRECMRTV